jgi:hypothetical protein
MFVIPDAAPVFVGLDRFGTNQPLPGQSGRRNRHKLRKTAAGF